MTQCKVCGRRFRKKVGEKIHRAKTVCGKVDLSKPVIAELKYVPAQWESRG